ncbi:hypothetical protein [Vibrio parahaemolyticus]|uniref:hypothetical protein n=1 Tax=Vibrio parahaemolyticus TaxID=670 RepID=UPI0009324BA6|nr:hypothetical protein [Vibrio parahaemolyticus]MQC72265.1 hypothetical protein [Vibrio parahaemolyticus]MQC77168.1 hypothetical protein [Vibrio parahaemolyticus]MQC82081.1 hypothetical protein [Vibrio parahaemolyticus]MQC92654.1 hypothetical protein [Vibrio parahaemolyticus]MQC97219.1 hypothetical protein [Vibrio parahaemolyticus]
MAYNISLNNITTTTAPVQQELSGISLQTSASALPRVDIQPNVNEHQLPQALSPSDSCLENEESSSQQPEVKKEQAEKKKKVHKKSNKYSNHTKAKGHLAAIAGATTLGAVLAPFTGGLSLLPTAFVVLFGNASALAMYGGSEFVLGQKGPNNQIDDKKDPEANKQPEENKQPEISVPVSPRPIRAQEFRGLDEVNGRREPEPEEKGSRGKGDTFNYSPVFNFNFGDLNFNQFNTQNNTQFNTQNNTDKTNQADTDSSPTLIEQTIEKFGGNPVINVEEITKDVLIRELREQEPLIGPESKVDEMIDALVSFHEQTNEAKLIQVSFESGHKAYIGGIPDTDEQKQTDPIKAEVCVEKAKKQWPEVKPAHRLITTSGNAKIDGNPGYRNARVDVDGQTVGYTRNERGGSQPQSSGVHTSQGSQQPGVEPSPVDPGHGASGAASVQPGGEAKGAQTPSLHTQGEPISTATQTGGAQGTQGGEDDGRPQVAQGHNPQGEPASLAKAGTPVDPGHGASDVASAQPGGEAKGTETPSLQTEGESISTSMPTGEEQGVQTGGVKKWPEVAAPQRVITSAGNAKIDGNPGYRNARVDVDGQTVGYTRNERGGSQPQSSGVHTSQGSQQPGVEPSPVDPGHGASGAASVQPGGEAKGAQTPSLHTQGEPISTATQTGGAQNIQSVTLARADLQQTNVERGRITDVTKLVDVKALASTVAANKSEPERFVSKLHITLKGNSSADSKVGTNQPESLQAWSSNMLSPGPGVKLAQKSLVQNEIELMPQANKGETVKKIEVVSNISGKKWTVSMPAPVLTTQGMASGRGKNYTQGLFHNIRDINQTKRNIELNSTLMESTPKSDVSFVNMGDKVFPIKPAIISNLKLVS